MIKVDRYESQLLAHAKAIRDYCFNSNGCDRCIFKLTYDDCSNKCGVSGWSPETWAFNNDDEDE